MLFLLPPSEGKATAGSGPRLDPAALSLPETASARETVLEALETLCAGPEEDARQVLGLSAGQAAKIAHNRELRTAPTLRAADLYTGVLYDRLGLGDLLTGGNAERVRGSVLIFSGLWGVVGVTDQLPPYRLSMGVKLPPLGALGAFWRKHLTTPLLEHAGDRLLVDCRSSAYAAAFKPSGETAERTVSVRVLRDTGSGEHAQRSVVSHMAKATRGEIARDMLAKGEDARTPAEFVTALNDLGYPTELTAPSRKGRPYTADIVLRDGTAPVSSS
ncbi:hypothetical protein FHX37_2248 [Haloactinospora alba]|uniref:Uncharacterized protein n=1 Tax=Haloactinospora alba TaxID=405555 RepID=A0A543NKF5_9ACTN|nr:peroxide stress protein YaaA [Haloactinospora alba]TQN32297.1 hypothetical protein FHX37_2248 [Haloactinospora alba]